MTFQYRNVFIENTSTVAGPYEAKGPLSKYFDKTFGFFVSTTYMAFLTVFIIICIKHF